MWRQKEILTTSGEKMKRFWCAEEGIMVTWAVWVTLAMYTVYPPWWEMEAGRDRRGFPNIFPKTPEGSWHLLRLLHQLTVPGEKDQHSQSREEHGKLGVG